MKLTKRWRAETTRECDEEEGEEEVIFVSTEVQSSRWIDRKCFHNIAFLYTRMILCILLIINFRLSHSKSCARSLVWNKKFTTPKRNVQKISVLLNFKCEIQRETLSKRWYPAVPERLINIILLILIKWISAIIRHRLICRYICSACIDTTYVSFLRLLNSWQ